MTVLQELQQQIDRALQEVLDESTRESVAAEALQVVPCAHAQFGDYQFNGALPLAKSLKTNPRALATQLLEKLEVEAISETPEIAGPGFINFRLKRKYLQGKTGELLGDARLGVPSAAVPRCVIVDYSSPNVAKPMHVGHIRSTVIGDAIARLLAFAGHRVVRDNHIDN